MFNSNGGCYSLADIAAATGNSNCNNSNDGWGNGGAWWIIILFLFVFCGWGNNGWGNNGNNGGGGSWGAPGVQGALTRGELCQDMNFADLEAGVRGIQTGLCDGFYAMNTGMLNGFAGIQNSLCSEFRTLDNAVCSLGYQTQAGINSINVANMQNTNALQTQIADCCCKTQSSIKDGITQGVMNTNAIQNQIQNCCCDIEKMNMQNRFDAQQNHCATVQAITDGVNKVINYMDAKENQQLRDRVQFLEMKASQAEQNTYLTDKLRPCPDPAYIVPNPFCNCPNAFGYSNIYGNNCCGNNYC